MLNIYMSMKVSDNLPVPVKYHMVFRCWLIEVRFLNCLWNRHSWI